MLGERGSASNPADITGYANSPSFAPILSTLIADPGLDAWLVATQGNEELVGKIIAAAKATTKPLAVVWTGSQASSVGLSTLQRERRARLRPADPAPPWCGGAGSDG